MTITRLFNQIEPWLCLSAAFLLLFPAAAQNDLQVVTLTPLNASGGLSKDTQGHIYVSDFGSAFGVSELTKVYRIDKHDLSVSVFAEGFMGASGANFDSQGNFYQSNPGGNKVSKRSPDGTIEYDWVTGMTTPVGIAIDEEDNLIVCNCGTNSLIKISQQADTTTFVKDSGLNCPNGITQDEEGNLYVCNFNDGRIIKVTAEGVPSILVSNLPSLTGGPNPIGSGHITYSNGFLYVALVGLGQIFQIDLQGNKTLIAGQAFGFSNNDGPALQATFSKPNGIIPSMTGDTLFINCSDPAWPTNSSGLHPASVRMLTGICSLPNVECNLGTAIRQVDVWQNDQAILFPAAPNPMQSATQVSFELLSRQSISLQLRDTSSKLIQILFEGQVEPGKHQVSLESQRLSNGIYFLILKGKDYQLTRKVEVIH